MDDSELRRLASTPVGRRWLLKVGGAGLLALLTNAPGRAAASAAAEALDAHAVPVLGERRNVYLALARARAFTPFAVRAAGRDHPVRRITSIERRQLGATRGLYSAINVGRLTHVAEQVPFPARVPVLLSVLARRRRDGRVGLIAQRMSVPRLTALRVARAGVGAAGSPSALYGDAAWRRRLGVRRSELDRLRPIAFTELDSVIDDSATAASLTNMHPEVANLDDLSAGITTTLLLSLPQVDALADTLAAMREEGELAYWMEDLKNSDGTQAYILQTNPDLPGYMEPMTDPDTGGPALAQTLVVSPALDESYGNAVRAAITAVKADPSLEGSTYYVTPADAPAPQETSSLPAGPQTDFGVQVSRSGWSWGTKVEAGAFDPTTRSIPLKIFNNWERILQVHVQYFADKSTMLPVDNHDQDPQGGQSFRSTDNSEYLTYVGDMPTSFGIPWAIDVNYSQATITLPKGANYARLLICGGGSGDAAQWRDFMPNNPYSGNSYPEECHWPLVLTMIFDLGVPLILFGFDAAIAGGQAVSSYKTAVSVAATANHTLCLQALDGFAQLGELGAYLGNSGVNTGSPAEALGTLGAAIPQLLWGSDTGTGANYEMFGRAALLVTEMVVQYAITKAIPIMGEVFGALAAVGDLTQMITCAAEMSAAPWVIDNEVRVTYEAKVTMSKDSRDASWPRGAGGVTYTLSCVTDGADTTRSFTATIPDGSAADIVVDITDVAISKTVQYVLRVVDGNGNLIGKGQSDVLPNDDTTNLPSAVHIDCVEQDKPLTSQTTFVRQDTLQHSAALNAYHWAPGVTVSATRTSKAQDLLELDLVTVGTVSGMVGSIWRSNDANDSYWVRSISTVEEKSGVQPQLAGPYTRRPHLVYDRLSPDLASGNNFFLEPQGSGGYLVRRLTLGRSGGPIGFTRNEAWGRFLQDLTAVTYHPSGFIVGVNSATGKLHKLRIPGSPVADDGAPTLSQAHAGNGKRPGLTQSPIGVCVTVDGTVVVLESGANRLQAFDVNGNPVVFFGPQSNRSYYATLHGSSSDTRLGLGVDGAGFFFVLTYSGSGSSAPSFRVDVHAPDGTFVVGPTGVSAGAMDVDYWRNLFTVNYAALTEADGTTAYVDPVLGRIQPSLSIFVPSNPKS